MIGESPPRLRDELRERRGSTEEFIEEPRHLVSRPLWFLAFPCVIFRMRQHVSSILTGRQADAARGTFNARYARCGPHWSWASHKGRCASLTSRARGESPPASRSALLSHTGFAFFFFMRQRACRA
jgi:hypothetical protein